MLSDESIDSAASYRVKLQQNRTVQYQSVNDYSVSDCVDENA